MATYYIKNSGNNNNTGLSDAQAWQTISKINGRTFSAGDQILFNKGDVWRDQLHITSSGTVGAYIVYSNYGTGANPRIYGSILCSTWTVEGHTNIWKSTTTVATSPSNDQDGNMWFVTDYSSPVVATEGIYKVYTSNFSNLTTQCYWTWNSSIVYIYSTTDPNTTYLGIEAANRSSGRYMGILMDQKNYLEFNGIDCFFNNQSGIAENGTYNNYGCVIRNCELGYNGYPNGTGAGADCCYNDFLFENNIVHNNGRRGCSVTNKNNYDVYNITIQNNTFYHGHHTTGSDISAGYQGTGNITNIIIRNNLMWDEPDKADTYSVTMWNQGPHGNSGEIHDLYIYNNIVKFSSARAIGFEQINTAYIYNNTFYGSNPNNQTILIFVSQGTISPYLTSTDINIKNNIFYDNSSYIDNILLGTNWNQSASEIHADYNLYYRTNNTLSVIYAGGTIYHMNEKATIISSYGWEIHGLFTDPLFVSSTNYNLQAGSPAIGAGVNLGLGTDFVGNAWNTTPSIGAYEYGSNPPSTTIAPTTTISPTTTSGGLTLTIGSIPITDIKVGSTQITKVIRNGITYWQV